MQFLRRDLHLKLISVALAVMVGFHVRKEENRIHRMVILPVSVEAPAGQRVVEPPPNTAVQVDLEGPADMIRTIEDSEVRLNFDPSGVKPGRRVQVPISVELPEKYQNRVIVSWRPQAVGVRLAADATKQFMVRVRPLNRLEGWEMQMLRPEPAAVTVSGAQEAVAKVDRVAAEFTLAAEERIDELVTVQVLDSEGRNITSQMNKVDPPQVMVKGMQRRVLLQKRVPVQPIFQAPPGHRVKVQVEPGRVRVTGPGRAVGEVYLVETEPIQIPPGGTVVSQEVNLTTPVEGITLEPRRVRVNLQLQPLGPKPAAPPVGNTPG